MKKLVFLFLFGSSISAYSQDSYYNPICGKIGFLESTVNARIASSAEIAVVSSGFYTDAGLYQNPALLSGKERYAGGSLSYLPCYFKIAPLKYYFSYQELNGFFALNNKNTVGINNIVMPTRAGDISDITHNYILSSRLSYSHRFTENFAAGAGFVFYRFETEIAQLIWNSSLTVNSASPLIPAYESTNAFAVDLGISYDKEWKISEKTIIRINSGIALNNLGPKVHFFYEPDYLKAFTPASLKLGLLLNPEFSLSEKLRLNLDLAYQADKYLVPTTPIYNESGDSIILGMDPDISALRALYRSFYDAPYGISEELHEIIHKLALETRLNLTDKAFLALRYGSYHMHETKGISYSTLGIGAGFRAVSVSYNKTLSEDDYPVYTWTVTVSLRIKLAKN